MRRGEERKSRGEEEQGKRRDPGAGGPISDYLVPGPAKTVSWPAYTHTCILPQSKDSMCNVNK